MFKALSYLVNYCNFWRTHIFQEDDPFDISVSGYYYICKVYFNNTRTSLHIIIVIWQVKQRDWASTYMKRHYAAICRRVFSLVQSTRWRSCHINFPLGWSQGWLNMAVEATETAASEAVNGASWQILLWVEPGWILLTTISTLPKIRQERLELRLI